MTESIDDEAFVSRLTQGDRDAIGHVVSTYLDHVVKAARGAGFSHDEADDLTQETFATFMSILPRFEGRSKVRTFLLGILFQKIRERRRKVASGREEESIDEVFENNFIPDGHWAKSPLAVDAGLTQDEFQDALRDCLDRLVPAQRMAFVLREVEDSSTEEISEILDATKSHVGVLLYRARNGLRECLTAKGEN